MTGASPSSSPSGAAITVRRMKFDLDERTPEYWHSGSPYITYLFAAASIVFPEGEKFFIDSVRNFEDQIRDPRTREEVRAFTRQEAHHSYQHRVLNELMARYGADVRGWDARVGRLLRFYRRHISPRGQLATTVACEHLTAISGHQFLTNPALGEGMCPQVKALWQWHAVEELEHRAVAFDVYQQIGGSYGLRIATMLRVLFGFSSYVVFMQLSLLARDRKLFDLRDLLRFVRFVAGKRGVRRALPGLFAFFRRDFHPSQIDAGEPVIDRAREFDGYVTG